MKPLDFFQTLQLSGQMLSQLTGLFRRPYWSTDEIQNYQLNNIKKIIQEAKLNVPLYQKMNLPDAEEIQTLSDLQKVPLLTKSTLQSHSPQEITNQKYDLNNLIVSKSSGSTGKALNVYYDLKSYNLFILAGLRLYFMAFPYYPWRKQTYIYTSPYPLDSLFGFYPMEFISTLNPIEDTIAQLRKNPPDLLVCYPSHLRSIADKMTPEDFKTIRPQAINVNSEMSSPAERAYLAKLFNSFVFDDYSSEELTRIASQCKDLQYHIFDDLNFIEIVDSSGKQLPEGEIGQIVGTNLHNVGMPLIRYNQGDRGALRTKKCECGRNFRILEKLEGRKNDAFKISSGETISSGFLLDLTYGVFLDYPGAVNSFCLVQNEPDLWTLELVPGSHWSPKLENKIINHLKKNLNRERVNLQSKIVQQVRKTASGKSNPIISLVDKS